MSPDAEHERVAIPGSAGPTVPAAPPASQRTLDLLGAQMSAARQAQRSGDRLAARHAWLGAGKTALAAGAWPEAIECALNAQP
ncbi:MAG TPA: hypothetical protein VF834_12165, partial [Streptosporangiaceae bacterium]